MTWTSVRQIGAIVQKDLRREVRTREVLTTTVTFAVLLMVVFTFAFYEHGADGAKVLPGILWTAILFTGTLSLGRTFVQEKESSCLRALALIPNTATSLFYAKFVVNVLFMAVFEAVLLPLLLLAFEVANPVDIAGMVLVVAAGTAGFAALGTLLAAMLVNSHLREALFPILLLPLLVPLLIVGVKTTAALAAGDALAEHWPWLRMMLALDVLYLLLGHFLFGYVLSAVE